VQTTIAKANHWPAAFHPRLRANWRKPVRKVQGLATGSRAAEGMNVIALTTAVRRWEEVRFCFDWQEFLNLQAAGDLFTGLKDPPSTNLKRVRLDTHPPTTWRNPMKSFVKKIQRFLASEDGPTAVEYAVMLALIIIVCLTTIGTIGDNANVTFQTVADELASSS